MRLSWLLPLDIPRANTNQVTQSDSATKAATSFNLIAFDIVFSTRMNEFAKSGNLGKCGVKPMLLVIFESANPLCPDAFVVKIFL